MLMAVLLFSLIAETTHIETGPPISFQRHLGKAEEKVHFVSRLPRSTLFFAEGGFRVRLLDASSSTPGLGPRTPKDLRHRGHNVFFEFIGANAEPLCEGRDRLDAQVHSFRSDWSAHKEEVFERVRYIELYPGIDLEFYSWHGRLEYDLHVQQGADLEQVVFEVQGASGLRLDEEGALWIDTPIGPLHQTPPRTFASDDEGNRRPIDSRLVLLSENRFGFEVEEAYRGQAVVVDPGLIHATWLGGSFDEEVYGMDRDDLGNVYLTGWTSSLDFPVTPGAFDESLEGNVDVFVAKFDRDLTQLEFATFIGGQGDDFASEIVVDPDDGSILLTGWTTSDDFPATPGAFDETYNGGGVFGSDAFAARLDDTGTSLLFATYLGGSSDELGLALTRSSTGLVHVGGWTDSADFPTTSGAMDETWNGLQDMFLVQLEPLGTSLIWSTYLGGVEEDEAWAITVDENDDLWVTGRSFSPNFPVSPDAWDPLWNGSFDVIVARVAGDGSGLFYSSFFGGLRRDEGKDIALDPETGTAYITGVARSPNFPVTAGVYDDSWNGHYDVFILKVDTFGDLSASTLVGGETTDDAQAIVLDDQSRPTVVGATWSLEFPTTVGAVDGDQNGFIDAFISTLDRNLTTLEYSTYLGGALDDVVAEVAYDSSGTYFVAGRSRGGFPFVPGGADESHNGGLDAMVFEIDLSTTCPASQSTYGEGWPGTNGTPSLSSSDPILCQDFTVTVENSLGEATTGMFFVGESSGEIPTAFDGTLLLVPAFIVTFDMPAVDTLDVVAPMPCDPPLCGVTIFVQVLTIDPGASAGVSFTNGIQLNLGN